MSTSEFSNAVPVVGAPSTDDAIRALIDEVQGLVDGGELSPQDGQVLTIRLNRALSFVEREQPRQAAQQLRVFVQQVTKLEKAGRLAPPLAQDLIDAANAIIAGLETS